MRHPMPSVALTVLMVLGAAACGSTPAATPRPAGEVSRPSAPQRTLVVAVRAEPPSLASKPIVQVSGALAPPVPFFNANLDVTDLDAVPHPFLAEALPQANTPSWQVFPDGRMETIYSLRPGLTWQDGTALSAEDFAFAWRVYSTPALGVATTPPIGQMAEVVAPDERTVVIRWRQVVGDAAALGVDFQALPRHILSDPFDRLDAQAFGNLPFWAQDYVGLGPYRVTGWEPGAHIEAEAFAGFVFGRPKIDRLIVRVISDPNAALANLLAGQAHLVADFIFSDTDAETLETMWAGTKGGTVLYAPVELRLSVVQLRPEHADPPALLDVRFRRGLAHAIDAQTAVQVLTGGKGLLTSTLTTPAADFYREVERVITRYPHDPRRAQQLLEEVGYARGQDGFFADRTGEMLKVGMWSSGGTKNEQENAVFVDSLRRSGINASGNIIPAAQVRDAQARALIPGLGLRGYGSKAIETFSSAQVPKPENRWQGSNRGGWSNVDYDRAFLEYSVALERPLRIQKIAEMERAFTSELPGIPHFYGVAINGHVAALQGPQIRRVPDAGVGYFNSHLWEWRS